MPRYLELLSEGQTVALDMLFAPGVVMVGEPGPEWREIQANSDRLVTRRAASFVRYCRQQANKYGIKGSRVAAARAALALLVSAEADHGPMAKLGTVESEVTAFGGTTEHASLLDIEMPGGRLVRHLEVCGRKMPFTSSIKSAREVVQRLVDEYGERALQAERNEGVDWKALSHAVRVGREALELLETGRITFPLPCAAEVLAIKRGERPYAAVGEEIERLLEAVDAVLDVNGWDLRKALQLMLRSNAVLIEWLTSPLRYRDWHQAGDLLALARSTANLTALTYHYQHQARRSFDAISDGGETASLKGYCYAQRSALAIAWIRQRGEAAPMDVETLMAGISLPEDLVGQLHDVIARKAVAEEDASMPRSATFDAFIGDALSMPVSEAAVLARKEIAPQADAFLAALLLGRAGMTGVSKGGSTCS